MKNKKIKDLKRQLRDIKAAYNEEKKRYSIKNKAKIKKVIWIINIFSSEENNMKKTYENKIKIKEEEIRKVENTKWNELFNFFSSEEKIKNVRLRKQISSNYSTNDNSN